MFPFVFEWVWDAAHVIFMGALWYVLILIGLTMTYCVITAVVDTFTHAGDGDGDAR